ncbi:MAG: hypothetical protein ACR2PT_17870 [Endozoicomonas sp.]
MRAVSKLSSLLLALVAISVLSVSAEEACWLYFPDDAQSIPHASLWSIIGRHCIVDGNLPYIGKVIGEGGPNGLMCRYKDHAGVLMTSHNFRALNASHPDLVQLINNNASAGVLHESVRQFEQRYKPCFARSGGHTHIALPEKPAKSTELETANEFCMQLDKGTIQTGSWGGNLCNVDSQLPSIKQGTTRINLTQDAAGSTADYGSDTPAGQDPKEMYHCDGYNYVGEGWVIAFKVSLGILGSFSNEGLDCRHYKEETNERCCRYARTEDCKAFSWDNSGKCCCGKKIDFNDVGKGNGDNRAFKRL